MTYSPLQLFLMYQKCRNEIEVCISHRDKKHYGIAVDSDFYARRWRKYQAAAQRIRKALEERLEGLA